MIDTEKEKLLNTTIAELAEKHGWPTQSWRDMMRFVHRRPYRVLKEKRAEEQRLLKNLTTATNLKDLLWSLEEEYKECRKPSKFNERFRSWQKLFSALGLTRLDSIVLPQNTVTKETLKAIPREKLMQMDASVLGTMSSTSLEYYRRGDAFWETYDDKDLLPPPTIAQLLAETAPPVFKESIFATLRLLKELGFDYEDGLFLQWGTRRKFIDDLVAEEGFSREVCAIVATIAEKHNWISFPAESI